MELSPKTQIDITEYLDYVSYISDLVNQKRKTGQFSFRQFCKKSGFKSPTYLKWVLDEVRPISPKSVDRFAEGLDLSKRETHYLQLMVNYRESKEPETKRFFFEELLKRREKSDDSTFLRERYEYLSHWYYITIRELIEHPEFDEDPQWIQKKLCGQVSLWEVKHAFKTLEQLKLIIRDDLGRWHQNNAELHTGKEVESMAAYNYHREVLGLSQEVLMNTPHEIREVSSLVSLMDRETFIQIKGKIQEFQDQIIELIRGRLPEMDKSLRRELFMLNMQLMPFSKFKKEDF